MPAETALGIVYPCGTDTIDCDVFADYAESVQDAISATQAIVDDALRPPAVYVRRTTSQTIAVGVATVLSYEQEMYDTAAMWDSAAPTLLTITQPGTYLVALVADWGSFAGTFTSARAALLRDGAEVAYLKSDAGTVAGTANDPLYVTALMPAMAVGEQISSTALFTGTVTANLLPYISATRISTT